MFGIMRGKEPIQRDEVGGQTYQDGLFCGV